MTLVTRTLRGEGLVNNAIGSGRRVDDQSAERLGKTFVTEGISEFKRSDLTMTYRGFAGLGNDRRGFVEARSRTGGMVFWAC